MSREESFGQADLPATRVALRDRLILNSLLKRGEPYEGKRFADIGCGFHAQSSRVLIERAASTTLADVALADDLQAHPRVRALQGPLPEVLEQIDNGSIDALLCSAVLEHLWDPAATLRHFPRVLAEGGRALINVPSWRGKRILEFVAFRLGMSTDEMDDHKMYYDPRDLWPLLIKAGFRPVDVWCRRHVLGWNTFAVCAQQSPTNA
jgi:SAM-dependent methyltransferase